MVAVGQLWEKTEGRALLGAKLTYLIVRSPFAGRYGHPQVEAWCLERRRLERFNASCTLSVLRWRELARDPA